jgi:protein-S-isoprenylcysteine O-methyltransferase Ste14
MSLPVLSWFPSRAYANLFALVVLLALMSDYVVARLAGGKEISPRSSRSRDRGSFLLIYLASLAGLSAGIILRSDNIGVVPFPVQAFALLLLVIGTVFREWAIALLGRFFSRTVTIEQSHQLITSGPYRWVRHPAYTGMLIMDTAIILGLGTWVGAVLMFILLLLATLYRIRIEEHALLEAFGDQYQTYRQRTALLFPPW